MHRIRLRKFRLLPKFNKQQMFDNHEFLMKQQSIQKLFKDCFEDRIIHQTSFSGAQKL